MMEEICTCKPFKERDYCDCQVCDTDEYQPRFWECKTCKQTKGDGI